MCDHGDLYELIVCEYSMIFTLNTINQEPKVSNVGCFRST